MGLIGKKFGNWTAKATAGTDKHQCLLLECQCTCGTSATILASKLRTNRWPICNGCKPRLKACSAFRAVWSKIVWGAYSRGLVVEIDWEFIYGLFVAQNEKYALTGISIRLPTTVKEAQNGYTTASLDRIDSQKGYLKENVRWLHRM